MATEDVKIDGPVKVVPDSPQRVAFDLMKYIAQFEEEPKRQRGNRYYWLNLYQQCFEATQGCDVEYIRGLEKQV